MIRRTGSQQQKLPMWARNDHFRLAKCVSETLQTVGLVASLWPAMQVDHVILLIAAAKDVGALITGLSNEQVGLCWFRFCFDPVTPGILLRSFERKEILCVRFTCSY